MIDLPEDFVQRTQQYIGDEWPQLLHALTQPATRAARVQKFAITTTETPWETPKHATASNPNKTSPWYTAGPLAPPPSVLRKQMSHPVSWYNSGSYISAESPLGKTPCHELGGIYIQEASAMAAVAALEPQPNERILDLCAAPGSKSTAIGRQLQGQALLYANEIVPARAKTLAQNLERSGIPALVTNDNPATLADVWSGQFDAVLVDAPCSGEGMFRKDIDAVSEWSTDNVNMCSQRQRDILECAVRLVKPGGRLVYSTCTLNPIENEQVAAWACTNLSLELEALPDWEGWDSGRPEYANNVRGIEYTRRLWPHRGHGEGHFVARFRVTEDRALNFRRGTSRFGAGPNSFKFKKGGQQPNKGGTASLKGKAFADWSAWISSVVNLDPEMLGRPVQYRDSIYVWTETNLPLTDVHVVRNGVCTATIHNQRFTPHHQFAMALHPNAFTHHRKLDEEEVLAYLEGNALASLNHKGWYGLSFAGLPAGWGKAVPGRLNNLYPKGLRKGNLIHLK